MTSSAAVYLAIGNSDDKLTQRRWAAFQLDVRLAIQESAAALHGDWHSNPDSIYQNACWCIEIEDNEIAALKKTLAMLAEEYDQNSIAWNFCTETEFIGPGEHT